MPSDLNILCRDRVQRSIPGSAKRHGSEAISFRKYTMWIQTAGNPGHMGSRRINGANISFDKSIYIIILR
jgi:hypothetical protein